MTASPRVSVIIPAYESHVTIAGCLDALRRQTFTDFEVIVVDSGPSDRSQAIVAAGYPEVHFIRSASPLPPQAARDHGVQHARGSVFVFTDPDIYPVETWLARLMAVFDQQQVSACQGVIIGAIDCYGHRWLDVGIHLCKFYKILPGTRHTDISPSGNMLCGRALFERMHGFNTNEPQGDVLLSWRLTDQGCPITIVPDAVVYHHHVMSLGAFVKERWVRGQRFAAIRAERERLEGVRWLWRTMITILPLRFTSLMIKVARSCARAGTVADYLCTLPVIALGQAVWLAGEARYLLWKWRRKTA
ncbi:MAG: glycosyltransferase [bacterium]|nr:glycosyltransferase [bacterium]